MKKQYPTPPLIIPPKRSIGSKRNQPCMSQNDLEHYNKQFDFIFGSNNNITITTTNI